MSKFPTPAELRERLAAGHFGESKKAPPGDPVQPTPMVVPVTKIDLYDHNPRTVANEKYEEIKESIRASGLEQPLSITRRPGAENYMVDAGGNTRLRILKELHQEHPDDRRFYNVHVLFQPWVSESHVLAKHLKENDLRGSLTFIDRARGIVQMREMLEQELGKSLSYRKLAQALAERGYRVDPGALSRFEYAANTLLPLIPLALEAGLGSDQIRKIRRIEKALIEYLEFLNFEDKEGPVSLWHECLAEVDTADENLPIDRAYETLARRLEPVLRYANYQSILIDLDLLQAGKPISRYEPPSELIPGGDDGAPENSGDSATDDVPRGLGQKTEDDGADASRCIERSDISHPGGEGEPVRRFDFEETTGESANEPPARPKPSSVEEAAAHSARTPLEETSGPAPGSKEETFDRASPSDRGVIDLGSLPEDLKSLRSRLWTQASRLARLAHIDDLIVPTPHAGVGYFIDLPEEPLSRWRTDLPLGDTEEERRKTATWWLLMELAEQSMAAFSQSAKDGWNVVGPRELTTTRWIRHLATHGSPQGMELLVGAPYWHLGMAMRLLDEKAQEIWLDLQRTKAALIEAMDHPPSVWIEEFDWSGMVPDPESVETDLIENPWGNQE